MADEQERCTQCEESALCLRRQLAQAQDELASLKREYDELWEGFREQNHDLAAVIIEKLQLRRVVEQVEWRGYDPSENGDVCPWCSWGKRDGHAPDCELRAALALFDGSKGGGRRE